MTCNLVTINQVLFLFNSYFRIFKLFSKSKLILSKPAKLYYNEEEGKSNEAVIGGVNTVMFYFGDNSSKKIKVFVGYFESDEEDNEELTLLKTDTEIRLAGGAAKIIGLL